MGQSAKSSRRLLQNMSGGLQMIIPMGGNQSTCCRAKATEACGVKQLCSGLRSGIDGGIHAMDDLWSNDGDEDNWGILLVGVRNMLNELKCMPLLWRVHHIWPSAAWYLFKTYHHWKMLVLRGGINIRSKEGVTQGDPLAMVLYALGNYLGNGENKFVSKKVSKWVASVKCFIPM
eukprot:7610608-Ditylum_brightwellii.AAC.1